MRVSVIMPLVLAMALAPCAARAAASPVCASHGAQTASQAVAPDWVLDHYVRSASDGREWAVMVDCNHPGAPERMRLAPGRPAAKTPEPSGGRAVAAPFVIAPPVVIRAGTPVTVVNTPDAAVTMNLTGVAATSAQVGQMIRVRLAVFHALVSGVVRGPGTVELVSAVRPQWGQP